MTFRYALLAVALLSVAASPAKAASCGHTTATSSPTDVVQAQVEAYNAHDLEAFAACYADDARVIDLAGKRPDVSGQAALRKAYGFLGKVPKAFGVDIVKRVADGPIVIDLEHLHDVPGGKPIPDAFAVYEVHNGKIATLWFPPQT